MYFKYFLVVMTLLLVTLSGCQDNILPNPSPLPTAEPSKVQSLPTNSMLHTTRDAEIIVKEIKQAALSYNQIIENEKKTGNFESVTLPDGSEGINFTRNSNIKVYNEYILIQEKIEILNNEYYVLYSQQKQYLPTPTFSNQNIQQSLLTRLLEEYHNWLVDELEHGTTIKIYSPIEMKYTPILIGESYIKMKETENTINVVRIYLYDLPEDLIELDIEQIQIIEMGNVSLVDISTFPYYRKDINLTTYETSTRFYTLYTNTHQIIEINPKNIPFGTNGLSIEELEFKAKENINLFSPEVNLGVLTPAHGSKIGTYFFRWEDHTKPLLDDGRSYPFIQVGLNGNGELLNYYNTLPLAH